jgi:uncharacterized protein YheU (UPF0270 family)
MGALSPILTPLRSRPMETESFQPLRIPVDALPPDTLRQLLEEYVTREGTDYGSAPIDLHIKTQKVEQQLRSGDAVILYDPVQQSVNIVTKRVADMILPDFG